MNLAEKKVQLEKELASIDRQIQACNHEYGETLYDPETVKVPYGYNMIKQGSDIWEEPEGYREEKRDRWSQTCKKCGHKRYTTKTIPMGYKPVF